MHQPKGSNCPPTTSPPNKIKRAMPPNNNQEKKIIIPSGDATKETTIKELFPWWVWIGMYGREKKKKNNETMMAHVPSLHQRWMVVILVNMYMYKWITKVPIGDLKNRKWHSFLFVWFFTIGENPMPVLFSLG